MLSLSRSTQTTNPDTLDLEATPAGWPDWTTDRIELGPCPSGEDSRWWAVHAPGNCDGYDVEPDVDELAAIEAAALASIEAGLIPPDCGFEPNTADGILHAGSDPRYCPCFGCVELRTRRFGE